MFCTLGKARPDYKKASFVCGKEERCQQEHGSATRAHGTSCDPEAAALGQDHAGALRSRVPVPPRDLDGALALSATTDEDGDENEG